MIPVDISWLVLITFNAYMAYSCYHEIYTLEQLNIVMITIPFHLIIQTYQNLRKIDNNEATIMIGMMFVSFTMACIGYVIYYIDQPIDMMGTTLLTYLLLVLPMYHGLSYTGLDAFSKLLPHGVCLLIGCSVYHLQFYLGINGIMMFLLFMVGLLVGIPAIVIILAVITLLLSPLYYVAKYLLV
jgi:hypothetical protein